MRAKPPGQTDHMPDGLTATGGNDNTALPAHVSRVGHVVPMRRSFGTGGSPIGPKRTVQKLLRECGVTVNGNRPCDLRVLNDDFYARVLIRGPLGLGQSYVDGWWTAEDLDGLIYRLLVARLDEYIWTWRDAIAYCSATLFNLQRRSRKLQMAGRCYDLGNHLYECMLDRRMIHSCGYWDSATTLDAAQEAKLELVFCKLGLRPGQCVLDVGCGWGGALNLAAERYQVAGVGITVSREQVDYACRACERQPVSIRLQDYRDLQGTFDHIFSIGMFEHVGVKNYRPYMKALRRVLRPGGRFLLQTTGTLQSTNYPDPWLDKYIFSNLMLPSQRQIVAAIDGLFNIEGWQRIGIHYDRTLLAWRANFERHWPQLKKHWDTRFYRMWRFYLSASAASFRAGKNDVWQVLLSPIGATSGQP